MGRVDRVHLNLHMVSSLSTRTLYKGLPVAIANDWGTLCCSITYGVWEFDSLEECLYFLIESSTSNNYLIEFAAKSIDNLLTYLLAYLFRYNGHREQEAHTVVLYLGEYFLADNLLDNQRHGNDNLRLDVGESLGNDSGRRNAVEVIDMTTMQEFKDELNVR